jgi:hypothetical protein
MIIRDEFVGNANVLLARNDRFVPKSRSGSSVTDLIPTLYDMAKIMMRIQSSLDKTCMNEELLEEFSKIASAIMKMTLDIEYLRRKGH